MRHRRLCTEARAANGVIVVTTKKGKKDRSQISVRYTKGANSRGLQEYERVGVSEYYPLMWETYRNSVAYRATNPLSLSAANADARPRLPTLVGYNVYDVPETQLVDVNGQFNQNAKLLYSEDDLNWEKPITRQGNREEANVSFSGGQEKTDYFLSLGYLSDKGFLIRSDYERFNGRLNVNSQLKPWFRTGANLSLAVTKSNQADADGNTSFVNPFFFSRNMGPIYPVYAYDPANPGQFLTLPNGERRFDYGKSNLAWPAGPPSVWRSALGGRNAAEPELLPPERDRCQGVWRGVIPERLQIHDQFRG